MWNEEKPVQLWKAKSRTYHCSKDLKNRSNPETPGKRGGDGSGGGGGRGTAQINGKAKYRGKAGASRPGKTGGSGTSRPGSMVVGDGLLTLKGDEADHLLQILQDISPESSHSHNHHDHVRNRLIKSATTTPRTKITVPRRSHTPLGVRGESVPTPPSQGFDLKGHIQRCGSVNGIRIGINGETSSSDYFENYLKESEVLIGHEEEELLYEDCFGKVCGGEGRGSKEEEEEREREVDVFSTFSSMERSCMSGTRGKDLVPLCWGDQINTGKLIISKSENKGRNSEDYNPLPISALMDEVSPASPPPHTASYISPLSVPLKIPPTLERDEHGKSPSRVEREEDDDEDRTDLKALGLKFPDLEMNNLMKNEDAVPSRPSQYTPHSYTSLVHGTHLRTLDTMATKYRKNPIVVPPSISTTGKDDVSTSYVFGMTHSSSNTITSSRPPISSGHSSSGNLISSGHFNPASSGHPISTGHYPKPYSSGHPKPALSGQPISSGHHPKSDATTRTSSNSPCPCWSKRSYVSIVHQILNPYNVSSSIRTNNYSSK